MTEITSIRARLEQLAAQVDDIGVDLNGHVRVPMALRDAVSIALSEAIEALSSIEAREGSLRALIECWPSPASARVKQAVDDLTETMRKIRDDRA
jgi:hypothetical protein